MAVLEIKMDVSIGDSGLMGILSESTRMMVKFNTIYTTNYNTNYTIFESRRQ